MGGVPDGAFVDLAGAAEPVGGAVAAEPCGHLGTAAVGGEERRCNPRGGETDDLAYHRRHGWTQATRPSPGGKGIVVLLGPHHPARSLAPLPL